jgi:hypothetical protein
MIVEYVLILLLRIKLICFQLGFSVSFGLKDLQWAKNCKGLIMERKALKELMYGSIDEMLQNSRYYYHSSVGANYSHFTEEGKKNLAEFFDMMAFEMKKCRDAEDEQRSRDLVMKELKS